MSELIPIAVENATRYLDLAAGWKHGTPQRDEMLGHAAQAIRWIEDKDPAGLVLPKLKQRHRRLARRKATRTA